MSANLPDDIVTFWKDDAALVQIRGPWLDYAAERDSFPYAIFHLKPGRAAGDFDGGMESNFTLEFQVFGIGEQAVKGYQEQVQARFESAAGYIQFPMTGSAQCMACTPAKPPVRRFVGTLNGDPIYEASASYNVQVYVP